MLTAVQSGDRDAFLTALAGGSLVLPAAADGRGAGVGWTTGRFADVTHVVAFTSPDALRTAAPDEPPAHWIAAISDVVGLWPDPTWWLAVNPGLPIAARVPVDVLAELPAPPPDRGEIDLAAAILMRDSDALTAALLRAEFFVPLLPSGSPSRDLGDPEFPWWRAEGSVVVFTSEARLGLVLGDQDFVVVNSMLLMRHWPGPEWTLAVNPGTVLAARLPGAAVQELGAWLGGLSTVIVDEATQEAQRQEALDALDALGAAPAAVEPDGEPEPALAEPLTLQLLIPHDYVAAYLDQGYGRAAGLVHAACVPGTDTPARLYRRLGVLGAGSPFDAADESVVVLRWPPDADTPAEWGLDEPRMESFVVPDGAELHRISADGGEELVARYDATTGRWQSDT